ncbi:MAG: acetyl esterase [Methanocella sp. PtaU1.Bin125]|nr:MAG: acetyl esterase [Methanocella sp. PtaU1.Bin125]
MKAAIAAIYACILLCVLLVAIFSSLLLFYQPGVSAETSSSLSASLQYRDVPYASLSPAQKLDIYMPAIGKGPWPVVIWIHGGCWAGGDKSLATDSDSNLSMKKHVLSLIERGYAVVSINYRLTGEAKFPAQIHDVKAAIRWVRANAGRYGFDADRIGVWGSSAGGHLAALAGTSGDVDELENLSLGNPKESSRVQAVVDYYGPAGLGERVEHAIESDAGLSPDALPLLRALIGTDNLKEGLDTVKALDPVTYISPDDPPFFIAHGTNDSVVPAGQSVEFYKKLRKVIGPHNVELLIFDGAGHGDAAFMREAVSADNLARLYAFLDKNLKPRTFYA